MCKTIRNIFIMFISPVSKCMYNSLSYMYAHIFNLDRNRNIVIAPRYPLSSKLIIFPLHVVTGGDNNKIEPLKEKKML